MSTDLLREGYRVGQAAGTDSDFIQDSRATAERLLWGRGAACRSAGRRSGRQGTGPQGPGRQGKCQGTGRHPTRIAA